MITVAGAELVNPARRRGRRPSTMLVLALLAIAIQSFVVQTHVHFISQYGWTAPVRGAVEPIQANIGSDQIGLTQQEALAGCPVCQAQATSGRAALTSDPVLPVRSERLPALVVARAFLHEIGTVSHIWQSRAPPAL